MSKPENEKVARATPSVPPSAPSKAEVDPEVVVEPENEAAALLRSFSSQEAARAGAAEADDDAKYQYYIRCHRGHKEPAAFLTKNPGSGVVGNDGWFATYKKVGEPYQVDVYCQHCGEFNELGEYFGELVMIAGSSRMATVTAVEASEIVHLDRAAFMAVIEHHDELTRHLAVRLAMRLRQLTQLAKQLALLDVQSRMLALLRSLGEPRSDGTCYIAQLPSQQQIGERVGASRSMINRVMRDFSACGRIQYRDAGIVLRGP